MPKRVSPSDFVDVDPLEIELNGKLYRLGSPTLEFFMQIQAMEGKEHTFDEVVYLALKDQGVTLEEIRAQNVLYVAYLAKMVQQHFFDILKRLQEITSSVPALTSLTGGGRSPDSSGVTPGTPLPPSSSSPLDSS